MEDNGAAWALMVMLALGWYAWNQHSRAEDLQRKLDTAHSQIEDLQAKASSLEEASDNLQSEMDRFDTENWRDVVGDAKAAAQEVDSAKDELSAAAANADTDDDNDD